MNCSESVYPLPHQCQSRLLKRSKKRHGDPSLSSPISPVASRPMVLLCNWKRWGFSMTSAPGPVPERLSTPHREGIDCHCAGGGLECFAGICAAIDPIGDFEPCTPAAFSAFSPVAINRASTSEFEESRPAPTYHRSRGCRSTCGDYSDIRHSLICD